MAHGKQKILYMSRRESKDEQIESKMETDDVFFYYVCFIVFFDCLLFTSDAGICS